MNVPDYTDPIVRATVAVENDTAIMANHLTPASMLGAKLSKDGDQWCVLLGENLQEGLSGFGDTPYAAYYAFWKAFHDERITVREAKGEK